MLDEKRILEHVAAFHEQQGRWPSAVSSLEFERSLGIWLNQQRVDLAAGDMDQFRRSFLDMHLPGWKISPEEAWHERAREASDFILAYGRLPKMEAESAGERIIAIWLTTQRALARTETLDFLRSTWLDAHCPGWRGRTAEKAGQGL